MPPALKQARFTANRDAIPCSISPVIHVEHGHVSWMGLCTMKIDQPSAAALIERIAEAIIVLDREGRCVFINHQAEELLQSSAEALIGNNLWEALPTLAHSPLREECRRACEDQKPRRLEERDPQLNRWIEQCVSPAPDGVSISLTDITERKRREEDLRLCEQSYSRLVHSLGGIVWVADGETLRFLYVSGQAPKILGYPVREWLEDPEFWRKHVHPDDLERCLERRHSALARHEDSALEYRMRAADGREIWFTETVSAQVHSSGHVRLRGILLEITEQKRLEREHEQLWHDLQERVKEFSALAGAGYLLQRTDWTMEHILRELVELLPAAFQYPEIAAARVILGDLQVSTSGFRETSDLLRAECRCESGKPCSIDVVYLEAQPHVRFGPFLAEEQLLLQSIADLIQLADDRRQAMETLEEREDLFRTLVQTSWDCFAILSEKGEILYQSPAIERMTGFPPTELMGRAAAEMVHPEDKLTWERFLQDASGKGNAEARADIRCQSRNGLWHVLEIVGRRIVDDQGRPAVVINSRDVSKRREIERQLRQSELRFRLLFEKNGAGMVISDSECLIWQANPAFCQLLGYTEQELLGKSILEITHPDDHGEIHRCAVESCTEKQMVELEKRYLRKDGEIVWAFTSSIPFTGEHGTPRCITTVQDITPRKRALEALRFSEQRYRSLLLASAQVVWIADAQGQMVPSSDWYALTGQTEEESRGKGWINALHPDDRERVQAQWASAVEQNVIYETEVRIHDAAGEYRDFSIRGAPVWDDHRVVREWVGSCIDITDRKRAAANVLTWKNRYDAAVIASRQLLYDWDMASDHVTYGGNTEAVLGCSLEEMAVAGGVRRWTERIHPDDRERFRKEVDWIQHTHQPFHIEYRLRHKDGSYRIVEDNGQCYVDEQGNAFRMTGFVSDITERKEVEQRLRASEERFRRIFEECGVGMAVTNLDMRFLQANPAYCRFLGYTEEELKTMTERELVYADDLPEFDHCLEEVRRGHKRILDLDKRCIRKDGRIVWAHLTGVFPSTNGTPTYCVAVVQDITARKQAEEEVKRRDRFYRSLIENSSDNITVLDDKGVTLFQSPAIFRQLGYRPEELVGKNNADLIHPDDRPKATKRLLETLRRGETRAPQYLRFQAKDGSWRILETVGKRFVNDSGGVVGIFNTRDVTERVIASEIIKRAKQQAEAANLAKDRFLAALSHELRTPLTPVVALLPSLVQTPEIPDHVRSDLVMIKQNVDLETRLIDDLLDLTRITQDKVHLNRQKIDAHELIQSTLEIVHSDADAKQIHLDRDLQAGEHHIWGDRVRLQQVLWNLLKNAIKFSQPQGHVLVSSQNPEPGKIRITVHDEGLGIEPDQLPRIFDAFVQTLSGSGHQFGGLGLGLFISRAMVEQHDGTISVESDGPGKGSTFHVTLATVPAEAMPDAEVPVPAPIRTSHPLRILLVEDHENTREVLTRLLKRQGHTVLPAQGVQEALTVADKNRVDIAISDLGLPDGSGLDLMPKLKSRYGLKGIAVSGYGMEGDFKRSREAGFDAHLVKPIDFKRLQVALQEIAEEPDESESSSAS